MLNTIRIKCLTRTRKVRKTIYFSFLNVLIIGILCYIDGDIRYAFSGDASIYSSLFKRSMLFTGYSNVDIPDSVLLIDVSYDQELVPAVNSYGDTIGTCCITDRNKIVKFLTAAKHYGGYKKIMVDIRLEKVFKTPYDKALTSLLLNMPNVYYPCHRDRQLISPELEKKAYYSDYGNTLFETSFIKYEYKQKNKESIPLAMTGFDSYDLGPLHFVNHHLSYNCQMIPMIINPSLNYNDDDTWNVKLGSDLLSDTTLIEDMIRNRIVVIGNMETDVHTTYAGSIPGSIINLNAYIALQHGLNNTNLIICLLWGIIYFILSFLTIEGREWYSYISFFKKLKSDIAIFLLSFVGFSIVVTLTAIAIFLVKGYMSSIFIPSTYFACISIFIKYKKQKNEKIN